jgi:hypothetical protein
MTQSRDHKRVAGILQQLNTFGLVQTVSAAHPAFYPMSTGVLFLGVKTPSVNLNTHLILVP